MCPCDRILLVAADGDDAAVLDADLEAADRLAEVAGAVVDRLGHRRSRLEPKVYRRFDIEIASLRSQ
jgi:hypothetical protein